MASILVKPADKAPAHAGTDADPAPRVHPADVVRTDAPARPDVAPAAVEPAVAFARNLSAAYAARDDRKAAALFSRDAVSTLIGEPTVAQGRAAIERDFHQTFARYREVKLIVGRIWVSHAASVIELVFTGKRLPGRLLGTKVPEGRVGLVGAAVVSFDDEGLVQSQRIYLDLPTKIAQVGPKLLPPNMKLRAVATAAPAGNTVLRSEGTRHEDENLSVARAIWAALEAHEATDAMAPCSDDYVYEDYAAPGPMSKTSTQEMVTVFLRALPDFEIVSQPVQFAAGDDVITENVERATFEGHAITLHGLEVQRFENRRVVEHWQYANGAEVLTQVMGMKALTRGSREERR